MLTSVDILYAAILTLIVWILVDLCSFSLYFFLFFSLCKAILTCCHTNEVIIIVVCVPCVFHGLCVGVYRHITDPSPHLLTFYQNQHKWLLIVNYVQCLTLCMYQWLWSVLLHVPTWSLLHRSARLVFCIEDFVLTPSLVVFALQVWSLQKVSKHSCEGLQSKTRLPAHPGPVSEMSINVCCPCKWIHE